MTTTRAKPPHKPAHKPAAPKAKAPKAISTVAEEEAQPAAGEEETSAAEVAPGDEAPAAEVDDLEDPPADPDALSAAPPRNSDSLISQLGLKWHELKVFADHLNGELGGELGEVLALARKYS